MAKIISGIETAQMIRRNLCDKLKNAQIVPHLALIRVGEKGSDLAYENGLRKTCDKVGIRVSTFAFPEDICMNDLLTEFKKVNDDPDIDGILVFKPLPAGLDERIIDRAIDPKKDMDCISPANREKLLSADRDVYFPCTAEAVIKIIEFSGKEIKGANAVVIGRSRTVGSPLGLMLISRDATVTFCHSKTKDIADRCKGADIVISACGVAGIIDGDIVRNVSDGCIAIDVGINFVNGKLTGDFVFDEVEPLVDMITTVPGGVGSVTNTILASHVARAAMLKNNPS